MNLEVVVRADQVIGFLKAQGATHTDADNKFPGGRHLNNITSYVQLMEAGQWDESSRPIMLDAKTGSVWKGTDRTAAIAQVDWDGVRARGLPIPGFHIIVEHPQA